MCLQIFSLLYYFWKQGVNYKKWDSVQMALCCLGMGCFRVPQMLCEAGNFETRLSFMRCSLLSFQSHSIAENKWGMDFEVLDKKLSALRGRFRVGRDNCIQLLYGRVMHRNALYSLGCGLLCVLMCPHVSSQQARE